MSYSSNEVKVGAVVLIGLALFVVVLVYLAGIEDLWTAYDEVDIIFGDVQGLRVGAEVRLAGVMVGSVSRIEFDRLGGEHEVELRLRLDGAVAPKLRSAAGKTLKTSDLIRAVPGIGEPGAGAALVLRVDTVNGPAAGPGRQLGDLVKLRVEQNGEHATATVGGVPVETLDWVKRTDRARILAGGVVLGASEGAQSRETVRPQVAVRVTLRVPKEARSLIRRDARVVVLKALTGQVVINVESSGSGPLQAAGHVLYGPQTTAFYEVAKELGLGEEQRGNVATILANIAGITTDLREWFQTNNPGLTDSLTDLRSVAAQADQLFKQLGPKLNATVDNSKEVTGKIAEVVAKLDRDLVATAGNVRRASAGLEQAIAENRPHVLATTKSAGELITNVNSQWDKQAIADVSDKLRKAVASVDETLQIAKRTLKQGHDAVAENRPALNRLVRKLESTADWLRLTAKEVYSHPWRLLSKPDAESVRSRDIYRAAREFNEGASDLEQAAAELRALTTVAPELKKDWDKRLETQWKQLQDVFKKLKQAERGLWEEMGEGK